jgi:hypothetical protein
MGALAVAGKRKHAIFVSFFSQSRSCASKNSRRKNDFERIASDEVLCFD